LPSGGRGERDAGTGERRFGKLDITSLIGRYRRIRSSTAAALLLAAGALLGYGPILGIGFLSDDFNAVQRAATGFQWHTAIFFRPVVMAVFWLDWHCWGLKAAGYHLTNLALHTLTAWLVGRLALSLGLTPWGSAFAAGLFVLLPSHTESVTWIAGRTDLLATLGLLVALLAYLRWRSTGSRRALGGAAVAFAAALAAKESMIVGPVLLAVLEVGWLGRPIRWPGLLGSTGLVAGYAMVRAWALGAWVGGYGLASHLAGDPNLVLRHVVLGLARLVLPPWPAWLGAPLAGQLYLSPRRGLLLAGLGALGAWTLPRRVLTLVAAVVVCVPLLGRLEVTLTDTRGERLLYTASVFGVLLIALGFEHVTAARARAAVAATVFLAALLALWQVNVGWQRAGERVDAALANPALIVPHMDGRWVFLNGWAAAQQLLAPERAP
jgi:hypothetical protein